MVAAIAVEANTPKKTKRERRIFCAKFACVMFNVTLEVYWGINAQPALFSVFASLRLWNASA
jgi:hypothetical protein